MGINKSPFPTNYFYFICAAVFNSDIAVILTAYEFKTYNHA